MRGIAVIGIAWMNVYAFALPLQAYYNPAAFGMESAMDRLVWLVSFVFIEDKFRTLFAMLFGAGCLILLERDRGGEPDNHRHWRRHGARMAVLFAIGLVHSVLLANNDILRAYALAGLALPLLAGLSVSALYAVAIGLVAVHVGGGMVHFGAGVLDFYAGRTGTDAAFYVARNYGSDPAAIRYALDLGQEGFGERVARRASGIPGQLTVIASSIPLNCAAMALGMALWRDRMLAGEWRTFRLQRFAAVSAIVAVPALLGIALWVSAAGFPGALVGPAALIVSAPFDMLLGFAYAMLIMAFLTPSDGEVPGPVTRVLASVGRLSLSNYLATSLIFAALFAGWGLGLFAQVTRAQAFALSFLPIAAMMIWSPVWASRFGQGPLERLWRRVAAALS